MSSTSSVVPPMNPGDNFDDYCTRLINLKVWKLPGYRPEDDPCNAYDYNPSKSLSLLFLGLFSFFTIFHLLQTLFPQIPLLSRPWPSFWILDAQPGRAIPWRRRLPLIFSVTCGGILEIVGWGLGRLASASNPDEGGPFTIQITALIIGPTFFSAAIYTLFGWFVTAVENPTNLPPGQAKRYSLLSVRAYVIVFVTSDIVSLVIQSIGGGVAATAAATDTAQQNLGTHVMEAGIVFQLIGTIIFAFLFFQFRHTISRASRRGATAPHSAFSSNLAEKGLNGGGIPIKLPDSFSPLWWAQLGIGLAMGTIIFRGVYRTIELAQGWSGFLISHEAFILLDSVPMVLCMAIFAFLHSNWTLPPPPALEPLRSSEDLQIPLRSRA